MGRKDVFLDFLVETGALRFGAFRLKSGRRSPYLIDMGQISSGSAIRRMGEYFAQTIADNVSDTHIIFGSAYKGIPLCVSAAMHLEPLIGHPVHYLFDRKEQKTYADADHDIRRHVCGRVPNPGESFVMIDDVMTTGGTNLSSLRMLHALLPGVTRAGLVIAVDRQELDMDGAHAASMFQTKSGIPVYPIATASDILCYLQERGHDEHARTMQSHLNKYGIIDVRR